MLIPDLPAARPRNAQDMILILSRPDDSHVRFLAPRLLRLGASFVVADPADFPGSWGLSFEPGRVPARGTLLLGDETLDLARLSAVLWRRPGEPSPAGSVEDPEQRANVRELAADALGGLWESLDCLWVPCKPSARARANRKPWQLAVAREIGLVVPDTVITNDPGRLLAFFSNHRGRVVTKPLSPDLTVEGRRVVSPTRPLARRAFRRVAALRHEAVIAQAFVPKAFELRVTVVGRRVFCARIDSGSVARAAVDWRMAQDRLTFEPHRLPDDVASRCVRLVRRMGLTFGAIDMIVTPDGRHVFLEINPAGQWAFMPGISGEIGDALASLLASGPTSKGDRIQ